MTYLPPTPRRPLSPQVADPWLRSQLPGAVLARPADDEVGPEIWQQVARCLEATGHAVACTLEGSGPEAVAVLAGFALEETSRACAALGAVSGPRHAPTGRVRRPEPVRVERSWFRLAGLLLGPSPADPHLLQVVLDGHRCALLAWRQVLLAPSRLAAAGRPA